jgi:limonene-1,2-epoxide hydrolase
MPTPEDFNQWLAGYQAAMVSLDADAAGQLFSADAVYCESPFAKPVDGRPDIVAYWRMVATVMSDVEFGFELLATSGNVGVARVNDTLTRVATGRRVRYDGIFFIRLDEAMQCEEFREWWVQSPD